MVSVNQNADKKSLFFIQIFLWMIVMHPIKLDGGRGPPQAHKLSTVPTEDILKYPFPVQYRGTDLKRVDVMT